MNEYGQYVSELLSIGHEERPRGLKTTAVHDVRITVPTGVTYRRYKDNPLIGFMEGLQFIAGTFSLNEIKRIAPNAKLELFGPTSSYGLRVGEQVDWIIAELNADPYSRRAVLILADPREELDQRPCTTSMQFSISKDRFLDTNVVMRSSDAVYGLPYDFIQFGMMSMMIANCVNAVPRKTVLNIGNAHVYDETRDLAKNFERWTFSLPSFHLLPAYEQWALFSLIKLNSETMVEWFNFKRDEQEEQKLDDGEESDTDEQT